MRASKRRRTEWINEHNRFHRYQATALRSAKWWLKHHDREVGAGIARMLVEAAAVRGNWMPQEVEQMSTLLKMIREQEIKDARLVSKASEAVIMTVEDPPTIKNLT